ncbi:MAG TPA: hypothetical protein VM915_17300 [Verrucomicrobiae bacterium]|nr:hypothetical protein [Verrucomicrobiae bacterium]
MIPAGSFFHNHTDADLQAAIDEAAPLESQMTEFERDCLNEMRAEQERRALSKPGGE